MELRCFGITGLYAGAGIFGGCNALRKFALPDSLATISQAGMIAASQTKPYLHIYIYRTSPANLTVDCFSKSYVTIYVPAESIDTYKEASGWSRYADKIQPMPSQE